MKVAPVERTGIANVVRVLAIFVSLHRARSFSRAISSPTRADIRLPPNGAHDPLPSAETFAVLRPEKFMKSLDFPGQRPLGGTEEDEEKRRKDEFDLNVGRAIDVLSCDVPLMFSAPPRLEIFTDDVILKDPLGELCHGRRTYGALHASLRVLGAITAMKPRVAVTSVCFCKARGLVEVKWSIVASTPLLADEAVKISAVSLYRVNDHGIIFEHAIDNRLQRDLWEYSSSWMGLLAADRPPCGRTSGW